MAQDVLSKREAEVMAYLIMGYSTDEMVRRMHVCLQTVKNHKMYVYKKLKVENATQVVSGWFLKRHDEHMVHRVKDFLIALLKEELGPAWNGCDYLPFGNEKVINQKGLADYLVTLEPNYWHKNDKTN